MTSLVEDILYQHPAFNGKYYESSLGQMACKIHEAPYGVCLHYASMGPFPMLGIYTARNVMRRYSNPKNFYHCLVHAISVAHTAVGICRAAGGSDKEVMKAYLAGIFHDAGYSIEKSDAVNVVSAVNIFKDELSDSNPALSAMKMHNISVEEIEEIIFCTQFNKDTMSFPVEPTSLAAMSVRDADLLGCDLPFWPNLLAGLGVELGYNVDNWGLVRSFLQLQHNFMSQQKFFIDSGKSTNIMANYLTGLEKVLKDI